LDVDGFVQAVDASNTFPNLFGYLGVHFYAYNVWFTGGEMDYRKGYEGNTKEHGNHEK
jgi:hypothetical protein